MRHSFFGLRSESTPHHRLPYRLLCSLLLLGVAVSAPAQIKCWQNKEGETECGSTIPPELAEQGHKEVNEQGLTVKEVEREPTKEEIQQLEKQAMLDAERQRIEEKQRRRDLVLTQTYTEEVEIIRSRDDKIETLEGLIKLAERRIEKLQGEVEFVSRRIKGFKEKGQEVPSILPENLSTFNRQIADQKTFIEQKGQEQNRIRDAYKADLTRFRELKGH